MKSYSEMIINYRKKNVLTQEELGKKIGISRQTLCNIEKGRSNPSILLQGKIEKLIKEA